MSAAVSGEDASIREGFLCPICLQDLNSVYQLQTHFEENHSTEDKAVFQHLKGFFGKAKRLLSKNEEQPAESIVAEDDEGVQTSGPATTLYRVAGIDDTQWPQQELGAVTGHFQYLRAMRGSRIDRNTVETNKLLIRLEKLVKYNADCSDSAKRKGKRTRKAFEKTVVPWKEDSSMKYCPICMERFGLSLRRHHCRLCGNIACVKCSDFLPNSVCENLLKSEEELLKEQQDQKKKDNNKGAEGGHGDDVEGTLRVCQNCDQLLVRRLQDIRQKILKPNFVLLYERLTGVKSHISAQLSVYNPRVESMLIGNSTHSRDYLERERAKILKNFDLIDVISKKILALSTSTSSPTHQRLFKKIRSHCSLFLQANMHNMVTLPTNEELEKLKKERRVLVARRIQEEKEAELEAQRQERLVQEKREQKSVEVAKKGHVKIPSWTLNLGKSKQDSTKEETQGTSQGAKTLEGGWKPSAVSQAELMASSDNPMVQQMNIIRNYIKQAKEMRKVDEVKMLEDNLRELEMEYRRQCMGL